MNVSLKPALCTLAAHFSGQFERICDHPTIDASDVCFAAGQVNELIVAIYAADLAVSHADPRSGLPLRAVASQAMDHLDTLRFRIAMEEEGAAEDDQVEEGGVA